MRTIEDYSVANYLLKKMYTNNIEIFEKSDDLSTIFKENPKLVCAINHGAAAAPFPVLSGIIDNFLKNDGANRIPLMIVFRAFYKVPLFRHFVQYMTQIDHAMTADEYLEMFNSGKFTDLFVLPEGENCMYGDPGDITNFLSPKFIEFSVRGDAPVLIVTHSGTEKMSTPYELTDTHMQMMRWLPKRQFGILNKGRKLNYPHFWEYDLDQIKLHYRLFKPALTEAELSEDPEERLAQLTIESNKVQKIMTEMKEELLAVNGKAKKAKRRASKQANKMISDAN